MPEVGDPALNIPILWSVEESLSEAITIDHVEPMFVSLIVLYRMVFLSPCASPPARSKKPDSMRPLFVIMLSFTRLSLSAFTRYHRRTSDRKPCYPQPSTPFASILGKAPINIPTLLLPTIFFHDSVLPVIFEELAIPPESKVLWDEVHDGKVKLVMSVAPQSIP